MLLASALLLAPLSVSVSAEGEARVPVESPVLTIDSDRLFDESAFGREIMAEIEAMGAELSAENRRIEENLTREEKELTDLRPTLPPEEFRVLADAFDAKVQETRRVQDAKSRDLGSRLEERRGVFINAAVPVLEQIMREAGAAVVLELRSVLIGSTAVDITRIAIDRLDKALPAQQTPPDAQQVPPDAQQVPPDAQQAPKP